MSTEGQKLKFKIFELEYVINFLESLKLAGYSSRMRTRFTKMLKERLYQFHNEYADLFKEYALFDNDGNPVSEVLENNQTVYKLKDSETFEKSLIELSNENFCIHFDDNNINMIKSVKESFLNCSIEVSGEDAVNYDLMCERFEELKL